MADNGAWSHAGARRPEPSWPTVIATTVRLWVGRHPVAGLKVTGWRLLALVGCAVLAVSAAVAAVVVGTTATSPARPPTRASSAGAPISGLAAGGDGGQDQRRAVDRRAGQPQCDRGLRSRHVRRAAGQRRRRGQAAGARAPRRPTRSGLTWWSRPRPCAASSAPGWRACTRRLVIASFGSGAGADRHPRGRRRRDGGLRLRASGRPQRQDRGGRAARSATAASP